VQVTVATIVIFQIHVCEISSLFRVAKVITDRLIFDRVFFQEKTCTFFETESRLPELRCSARLAPAALAMHLRPVVSHAQHHCSPCVTLFVWIVWRYVCAHSAWSVTIYIPVWGGGMVKRVFHSVCSVLFKVHFENIFFTKWWHLHSYFSAMLFT